MKLIPFRLRCAEDDGERKNAIGKIIAISTLLKIAQFSCTGHEACLVLFQF